MKIQNYCPQLALIKQPGVKPRNTVHTGYAHGVDQVHFQGKQPKFTALDACKIIYQLAESSYADQVKWKRTDFEPEGEEYAVHGLKTKLKDGRTVCLGGDFNDIEAGTGTYF